MILAFAVFKTKVANPGKPRGDCVSEFIIGLLCRANTMPIGRNRVKT